MSLHILGSAPGFVRALRCANHRWHHGINKVMLMSASNNAPSNYVKHLESQHHLPRQFTLPTGGGPPGATPQVLNTSQRRQQLRQWGAFFGFHFVVLGIAVIWYDHILTRKRVEYEEQFGRLLRAVEKNKMDKADDRAALNQNEQEILDLTLKQALEVTKKNQGCWCMPCRERDHLGVEMAAIRPHEPETQGLYLMNEDVPLIEGVDLKHSVLTDLFTSRRGEFSLPFNFVHFGLSKAAPITKSCHMTSSPTASAVPTYNFRRMSIVYTSPSTGYDLVLTGTASVVADAAHRRHYWLPSWAGVLPDHKSSEYILVKLTVDRLALHMRSTSGPLSWQPIVLKRDITENDNRWHYETPSTQ